MRNHPNRNWRSRWRVDLSTCTATHLPTGIVVTFTRHDDDRFLDGKCDVGMVDELIAAGRFDARDAARLMREAGDIYKEALDDRH